MPEPQHPTQQPPHTPGDEPARYHTPPTPGLDIDIIHADERFVVINKPAGMLSVPGRGDDKQDCARVRVQERFPDATGPMTCHRLDMDTSGLLVLALDPETHRKLSGQFEKRRVRKWYIALLEGHIDENTGARRINSDDPRRQGRIELSQCVDWENRPLQKIDWTNGKRATTDWIELEQAEHTSPKGQTIPATRVEMRPITGRTHQLRIAAAIPTRTAGPGGVRVAGGLGAPIIGDRLYGDENLAPRLCLHAERLGFWHPWTGDWVKFEQPAPF